MFGRLMAKTILNFHFDYWNPSLIDLLAISKTFYVVFLLLTELNFVTYLIQMDTITLFSGPDSFVFSFQSSLAIDQIFSTS